MGKTLELQLNAQKTLRIWGSVGSTVQVLEMVSAALKGRSMCLAG